MNTLRAKTGVAQLDSMLCGGLLKESITLVSGDPGTGKSTLATQFLMEGIRNGESGAYLSLEEEKHGFFRNMCAYGWDLKALESHGKLYFEFFQTEELVKHITDGYQTIDQQLRRVNAKRLVIDSVTAYLLACDSELSKRDELKRLSDNIRKWKVTAVLTGESRETDTSHGTDYMVDTIIRLYNMKGQNLQNSRQRLMEVEKMRGSNHSQQTHKMRITSEGVTVEEELSGRIITAQRNTLM